MSWPRVRVRRESATARCKWPKKRAAGSAALILLFPGARLVAAAGIGPRGLARGIAGYAFRSLYGALLLHFMTRSMSGSTRAALSPALVVHLLAGSFAGIALSKYSRCCRYERGCG